MFLERHSTYDYYQLLESVNTARPSQMLLPKHSVLFRSVSTQATLASNAPKSVFETPIE